MVYCGVKANQANQGRGAWLQGAASLQARVGGSARAGTRRAPSLCRNVRFACRGRLSRFHSPKWAVLPVCGVRSSSLAQSDGFGSVYRDSLQGCIYVPRLYMLPFFLVLGIIHTKVRSL